MGFFILHFCTRRAYRRVCWFFFFFFLSWGNLHGAEMRNKPVAQRTLGPGTPAGTWMIFLEGRKMEASGEGREGSCAPQFGLCAIPSVYIGGREVLGDFGPAPSLAAWPEPSPPGRYHLMERLHSSGLSAGEHGQKPSSSLTTTFWRVAVPRGLAAAHAGRVGDGAAPTHPGEFWGLPSGFRVHTLLEGAMAPALRSRGRRR